MVGQRAPLLRFYGPKTAQALQLLHQLKANQFLDVSHKKKAQARALATLFSHAYEYSPFWSEKLKQVGFEVGRVSEFNFENLSPLTRVHIQENFVALRARWPQCQPDKVFTVATSGSTGQPVRVEKYTDFYQPLDQALALLELEWFGRDPSQAIAYIGPQLEDKHLSSWGGIYAALGYRGAYYKRNFSDKTVSSHLDWIETIRPRYLKCSPFLAAQMAEMAIASGRHLQVDQIISVSETVSPKQRQLCMQGFDARIVDRYSSEETGMIALQCPKHDHLHVIDSTVLVEIVDDDGKPCELGQVGKVLVTALHSFAMPIIRYDLGDFAEWGTCDCGRTMPVIKRVWGRTRASVSMPGRGSVPMGFIGDDLGKIETIKEFRLRQYSDYVLELELVTTRKLSSEELLQIKGYFLSYGLENCDLVWCYRDAIDWPANRKREEFVRVSQAYIRNDTHYNLLP